MLYVYVYVCLSVFLSVELLLSSQSYTNLDTAAAAATNLSGDLVSAYLSVCDC